MRIIRCKNCGIELKTKEDKFKLGNKTYCQKCYNVLKAEDDDRVNLIDYVMKIFNTPDRPPAMIVRQIKEYKEKYGVTYAGLQYTLWYCVEVLHMNLDIKYGIAIVQYKYEEAEQYWNEQYFRSQQAAKALSSPFVERKISYKHTKPVRKNVLIDINELIGGD